MNPTVVAAGAAAFVLFAGSARATFHSLGANIGDTVKAGLAKDWSIGIYELYMPMSAFGQEGQGTWRLLEKQFADIMPLYGYTLENSGDAQDKQELLLEEILFAESEEGMDLWEESSSGSEKLQEEGMSIDELLQAENAAAIEASKELEAAQSPGLPAMGQPAFLPHTPQMYVDMDALQNFETLLSEFYIVDATTMVGSNQLDVNKLTAKDMTISTDTEGPQILIYHTHSQEGFADSVPGDEGTTIVGVGERLTRILTEQYGYQVLHYDGRYDVEGRNNAYSNALPDIAQVLEENPSIQVVIDLHRDEMPEETRLVMDLDGRPTARFMFFNGLSRTRKTGDIDYLYNENLEDNLAFSFQMQKTAVEYYPGLTRKIYLKGYRYNMHLCPKTLLIELGAQNNTVEEAMNACDPLAHILHLVLSGGG